MDNTFAKMLTLYLLAILLGLASAQSNVVANSWYLAPVALVPAQNAAFNAGTLMAIQKLKRQQDTCRSIERT